MRFRDYNKIMVLGTGGVDEDGELYLSPIARSRSDRAAEAYFENKKRFDQTEGLILLSGGYGEALFDEPPVRREALLMADYIMSKHGISSRLLLTETDSTTTQQNFENSVHIYPEFFEEIVSHERKLALVSSIDHLERAIMVGSKVLECYEKQFVGLGARQRVPHRRGDVPKRVRTSSYVALAADE